MGLGLIYSNNYYLPISYIYIYIYIFIFPIFCFMNTLFKYFQVLKNNKYLKIFHEIFCMYAHLLHQLSLKDNVNKYTPSLLSLCPLSTFRPKQTQLLSSIYSWRKLIFLQLVGEKVNLNLSIN